MNYSILLNACSIFIAASALIIAWRTYYTNRLLPNENKLFEEKIRSFRNVIVALNTAAAVYIECGNEFHEFKESDQRKFKEEIDLELSKAYYLMEDTVHEQMLILSDEVIEKIDSYFELFDQEDFLMETAKSGNTEQFEDKLNTIFDAVVNTMREDLAFEKLDKRLSRRIGSRQPTKVIRHVGEW